MNKELLDFLCSIAMEEHNNVWNDIYYMIDKLGIVVPDYVEYNALWAWLALRYNACSIYDGTPVMESDSEEAFDYEEMWAQYAE